MKESRYYNSKAPNTPNPTNPIYQQPLGVYRGAADREHIFSAYLSPCSRFAPWQTKNVTLRPEHPLDECATLPPCYGFCHHTEPHCITQITPQQIIDGFKKLERL